MLPEIVGEEPADPDELKSLLSPYAGETVAWWASNVRITCQSD
jgi:hypothetical protein